MMVRMMVPMMVRVMKWTTILLFHTICERPFDSFRVTGFAFGRDSNDRSMCKHALQDPGDVVRIVQANVVRSC